MELTGLSVVIPHYGDPTATLHLIDALSQQVDCPPLEIIVSDDASPDPFPAGDGYIVKRAERNAGFGTAVNRGAAHARFPGLLIMNSDVDPDPAFIHDLLAGAAAWMPAVVAPPVEEPWGDRVVERTWPTVGGMCVEHLAPLARFHGHDWMTRAIGHDTLSWRAEGPHVVDWAVGVCLLLPTADFRAVGGFDERFFMNCEEVDLQRRLREQRGLRSVVLDAPRLRHAGGASSPSQKRAGWLLDSRFKYQEKWGGAAQLYVALGSVFAINAVWTAVRRAGGRPVHPLQTWKADMKLLDHAWEARR